MTENYGWLIDAATTERMRERCYINSNGCWIWRGGQTSRGYGVANCRKRKKAVQAHRLAWESRNGEIPAGMIVRHMCHNPLCVNPDHLDIGTQRDNYFDSAKGGKWRPGPNGNPLPPKVHFKHGSYYFVDKGRWEKLGRDYHEAMHNLGQSKDSGEKTVAFQGAKTE